MEKKNRDTGPMRCILWPPHATNTEVVLEIKTYKIKIKIIIITKEKKLRKRFTARPKSTFSLGGRSVSDLT